MTRHRGQKTSYTGSDSTISISQNQGRGQSQLTLTNDRLSGRWSPRVVTHQFFKADDRFPAEDHYQVRAPSGRIRPYPAPDNGYMEILGYVLVPPRTNSDYSHRDPKSPFEQFLHTETAYIFEKNHATPVEDEGLTPRIVIQDYIQKLGQPSKSGWGYFRVLPWGELIKGGSGGFRVVAIAEVPPGTEFAYPFRKPDVLMRRLKEEAEHLHWNPNFVRVGHGPV